MGLSSTAFARLLPLFCPPPFASPGCTAPLSMGQVNLLFLRHAQTASGASKGRSVVTFEAFCRCLAHLAAQARPSSGATHAGTDADAWSLTEGRQWMAAALSNASSSTAPIKRSPTVRSSQSRA